MLLTIINGITSFIGRRHWRLSLDVGTVTHEYRHDGGYCFTAPCPYPKPGARGERASQFALFEDDIELIGGGALHDEIRTLGSGRHSVWGNKVYFSTSDNSSPNENGRFYRLLPRTPTTAHLTSGTCNPEPLATATGVDCFKALAQAIEKERQPAASKGTIAHGAKLAADELATTVATSEERSAIVLVTSSLQAGGAERQWVYLARELDRRGHDVTILTTAPLLGEGLHYSTLLRDSSVTIVDCSQPPAKFPYALLDDEGPAGRDDVMCRLFPAIENIVWQLYRQMKERRPRMVACQLDYANVCGGLAAWCAGVPTIALSVRNVNPSNFPRFHREWFAEGYRQLARSPRVALTGNSQYGCHDYARWLDLPQEQFIVIPNGVDLSAIEGELSSARASNSEGARATAPTTGVHSPTAESDGTIAPVVLGVFRLAPEKEPFLFLDMAELILAEAPATKFVIVGTGPLQRSLERELATRQLKNSVSLLGRQYDVTTIMSQATILVQTSRHEGLPNVLLEGQAVAIPLVATDVGGTREAVAVGKTALLCPAGDAQALARNCLSLLTDADRRQEMSAAGPAFIKGRFTIETMTNAVLSLQQQTGTTSSLGN